ncbi:hypothetical protein GOM49_11740 [Clostridium bovifaecis]|uniref:Uncharacterized protein n=1 Tax=Clostridium bovifaecis TaxID=2184719 RepID=A0A6I6EZK1_9CLOT|nr:hypothetical protein GOM49_11740 [Clostridium bovifaecis]
MDKRDLQEVIHEEVGSPLKELASSFKKEKKKTDYISYIKCCGFCAFMLYLLYLLYKISVSIDINLFY